MNWYMGIIVGMGRCAWQADGEPDRRADIYAVKHLTQYIPTADGRSLAVPCAPEMTFRADAVSGWTNAEAKDIEGLSKMWGTIMHPGNGRMHLS